MFLKNIRVLDFESKLLRGNPMGNSSRRSVVTLFPDDFDSAKRYPTIWFLDGYFGNGISMLKASGPVGRGFPDEILAYQRQGLLPKSICIFPDCSTWMGGSQYMDSVATGPFLSHFIDELLPFVDAQLPTISKADARILTGHSSGGYGALVISMLRPGHFDYVIASAADSLFEYSQRSFFPIVSVTLKKSGGIENFLAKFLGQQQPDRAGKNEFITFMTLAMASCYSPNLGATTIHADLPFNIDTLEIIPEIWKKWLDCDPVNMIERYAENLKNLEYLHLDCGADDEYMAQFGHRILSQKMRQNAIKHIHTEFPGSHSGTQYRYKDRFQLLKESAFSRFFNLT